METGNSQPAESEVRGVGGGLFGSSRAVGWAGRRSQWATRRQHPEHVLVSLVTRIAYGSVQRPVDKGQERAVQRRVFRWGLLGTAMEAATARCLALSVSSCTIRHAGN